MSEITAGELWQLREELEKSAASVLGYTLFEFARLDMATGMCVSWVDEGRQLEAMTRRAVGLHFSGRLQFLSDWVNKHLPTGSESHTAYTTWIAAAHLVRSKRNDLVHGRWGPDAEPGYVINVVGLPNSPDQTQHRYTLSDLEAVLAEMKRLQSELCDLRRKWPL